MILGGSTGSRTPARSLTGTRLNRSTMEPKGPQVGLESTTTRLQGGRSPSELLRHVILRYSYGSERLVEESRSEWSESNRHYPASKAASCSYWPHTLMSCFRIPENTDWKQEDRNPVRFLATLDGGCHNSHIALAAVMFARFPKGPVTGLAGQP